MSDWEGEAVKVTMRTEIMPACVYYSVWRQRDGHFEEKVWERRVEFRLKGAYRPGGAAFREAAQEQERQAEIALAPEEPKR